MSAAPIDYEALAQQARAPIDYAALAAQARTPSTPLPITANPNGEGTYKMNGPNGTLQIPFSNVGTAQTQGLQLHPDDVDRYGKDAHHSLLQRGIDNFNAATQGPNPGDNPIKAQIEKVGQGGGNAIRSVLSTVRHPVNAVSGLANSVTPDLSTTSGKIEAVLGPGGKPLVDTATALIKNPAETAGNLGMGAIMGGAASSILPEAETAVAGENYTPTNLKAHAGLLGRATGGLGDNFIPQQAASNTLSTIRQAAADNPAIAAAARMKGSTPQNIAAFQNILQKANSALEAPHAATIAQYAAAPADVSAVQNAVKSALPDTLAGVAPEDAAALQDLSTRLGTVNTMGGLNDLRTWLNNEAAASYKQDGIAANRGAATQKAYRTAADTARDSYYDQLQQLSGKDFQPIKQQQSQLMYQQEGLAGLGKNLSAQQAIADEPKAPQQVLSDVLTGGRALKAGPIAGAGQFVAEKLLNRTPLTQPNYLIRKALSNLPEASPAPVVGVSPTSLPNGPALPPPSPSQLPAADQIMNLPPLSASRLLSDSSSARSMPIQTPYPDLNEATASTRIQPTQFANPEILPPNVTRPVGPDGQVGVPLQRFLDAGPLGKAIQNPSTNDLIRAIAEMRKRKGN